jgi:hypothetical protein
MVEGREKLARYPGLASLWAGGVAAELQDESCGDADAVPWASLRHLGFKPATAAWLVLNP